MGKRGRPGFSPTPAMRKKVRGFVSQRWGRKETAAALEISIPTLRKYFSTELKLGEAERRASPQISIVGIQHEGVGEGACRQSSGAVRQRRLRARRIQGERVFPVRAACETLREFLVDVGYLEPEEARDIYEEVADYAVALGALQNLFDDLKRGELRVTRHVRNVGTCATFNDDSTVEDGDGDDQ